MKNPWLKNIPENWHLKPIKFAGILIKGKLPVSTNNEGIGMPIIGASEMLGKEPRQYSIDTDQLTCSKEDILILWDGANAGIISNSKEGIVSSTAVKYSITDKDISKQFAFYFMKGLEPFYKEKVNGTTIPHMNSAYLDETPLCFPSLEKQSHIASYLDEKCTEIDSLISLQNKMIARLQEYKQSVITEVVTRGLDPNVPMKDSGIEWIGMIPETFQLLKLGRVIENYKAGPFGSSLITGKLLHDGDILVYTPEHVARQSTTISNNLFLQKERVDEMQQFFVKPKDIIFPIVGSLGRAMVIDENMPVGIINQRLSKFNLDENIIDIRYFMWCFGQSEFYKTYIEINCRGAIIVNLTKQLICAMPLVCPSLEEQHQIADFLDRKCSEIDSLIDIKKQKIEALKEYKKSLIYECVTGKKEIA